jgi:DNA-binding CsgD family transcriptional regulator
MPMKCPTCHALAYVSYIAHHPDYTERRRKCDRCGLSFVTHERYAGGNRPERRHIDAPVLHPDLTRREAEVLALLAEGKTNREIGVELGISAHTVKNHLERVYAKLEVTTRLEAALWAVQHWEEL